MITRVVYVDILKGFSMMAVVLFHIDCQFPKASWFCPYMFGDMWHVPLFFLLSGFFIKDEKLSDIKDFLKSKLKVLYVKGLYYFIPVVLLHNYFIYWGWYKMDYSYSGEFVKILEMGDFWWLILKNFLLMSREPIVGAMWFVDSLLIAMVGLCLLKWVTTFLKVNKDFWFCIMVLILVVMSNVLTREYGVVIPKISNSITAMGCFVRAIGCFVKAMGDGEDMQYIKKSLLLELCPK